MSEGLLKSLDYKHKKEEKILKKSKREKQHSNHNGAM